MQSKIIFINRVFHPDGSATSKVLTQLVQELGDLDKEILIFTGDGTLVDTKSNVLNLPNGVKVKRCFQFDNPQKFTLLSILNFLLFHVQVLTFLLAFSKHDWVVVSKSDPPMLGVTVSLAKLIKKFRFISWQQDIFPETALMSGMLKENVVYWCLHKLHSWALHRCDVAVVPGHAMAMFLRNRMNVKNDIYIIPNPIDKNIYKAPEARSTNHDLESAEILLGYAGNLGRAHELENMFSLISSIQEFPEIRTKIVGGGVGHVELKKRCELHTCTQIEFTSYVEDHEFNTVFNKFNCHLVSLRHDFSDIVFPSKFYNGIMIGIPTIYFGPNDSDIAHQIKKYNIGYIVEHNNDIQGCIDFLKKFKQDSFFRKIIRENCKTFLYNENNINLIKSEWLKIL